MYILSSQWTLEIIASQTFYRLHSPVRTWYWHCGSYTKSLSDGWALMSVSPRLPRMRIYAFVLETFKIQIGTVSYSSVKQCDIKLVTYHHCQQTCSDPKVCMNSVSEQKGNSRHRFCKSIFIFWGLEHIKKWGEKSKQTKEKQSWHFWQSIHLVISKYSTSTTSRRGFLHS